MKKILIVALFFLLFCSACKKKDHSNYSIKKEYYPSGELRAVSHINNLSLIDSITFFYKNGKVWKKGLSYNNKMFGWWHFFDISGKRTKSIEYKIIRDSLYNNQSIIFDNNEEINYALSSFFEIQIKDTLSKGISYGKVKYNKNIESVKDFIYIVIENKHPNGIIMKDTFTDMNFNPKFGVYFNETGKKKIKGFILHKFLVYDNADSTKLFLKYHEKYFEKDVYVK